MPSASVRDVAALAGVSVGTVSNVLNRPDRVSQDSIARVRAAIDELGFVRNDAARQLRAGRSKAIGMVILDVRNPFFTDVARGAEDQAAQAGYSVILGNSDENADREGAYLDLFEEQRVRGVLLSPYGDVAERLRRLRSRGIPAVLVDRPSSDSAFSSVSVDDVSGGTMAAEHLIERGRTRIAFVGGPLDIRQVSDRLEGARRAVAAHPGTSLEVVPVSALGIDDGHSAGQTIAERPASRWPDAVFAANDLLATGLLQALSASDTGVVPGRIALIGYDDIAFARAATVSLSSIRQPSEEIGRTAMRLLLETAENPGLEPQHIVFQPELVARASTR